MDLGGAKRSRSPSAASPAILWFLSHRWERNSPPAGGETPLRKEASSGPMRASGPTKKRSIIAPSSAPFGGTYPYPLCRFATSPLDKGSRPPEGKAFGGDRPLIRPPSGAPSPPGGRVLRGGAPHPPGGGFLARCPRVPFARPPPSRAGAGGEEKKKTPGILAPRGFLFNAVKSGSVPE